MCVHIAGFGSVSDGIELTDETAVTAWSAAADTPVAPTSAEATATTPQQVAWIQLFDADNNTYYYNSETGESRWDRPAELALDAPPLLDGSIVTEQVPLQYSIQAKLYNFELCYCYIMLGCTNFGSILHDCRIACSDTFATGCSPQAVSSTARQNRAAIIYILFSQDVDSSEQLAEEWVSQDVLNYERSITAALEAKIKELNAQVSMPLFCYCYVSITCKASFWGTTKTSVCFSCTSHGR